MAHAQGIWSGRPARPFSRLRCPQRRLNDVNRTERGLLMRWWIPCSAAFLTITIPAVALAQPVIMRQVPRDVYGNILVVPEYAYPQGYADQGYVTRPDPDPYPRPSRRGADRRSDPRYAPIDPSTGYP